MLSLLAAMFKRTARLMQTCYSAVLVRTHCNFGGSLRGTQKLYEHNPNLFNRDIAHGKQP